ncbi:MAG: hypothetical protein ACJ78M_11910 [Gemmatimonadaceae bacterium]
MTRVRILLLGVAALCAVGWLGYRKYSPGRSPFALFLTRAGMPFEDMNKLAKAQMHRSFDCEPSGRSSRMCKIATDGPIGEMHVLVDGSGHAAVVRLTVRDSSLQMREEGRKIPARWNQVVRGATDTGDPNTTRWVTADNFWRADVHRGNGGPITVVYTLTDVRRLARMAESDAASILVASRAGMVDDATLAQLNKPGVPVLKGLFDSLTVIAHENERKAKALPECAAQPTVQFEGSGSLRAAFAENAARSEQSVAKLFPGSRLVFGDREMYLVEPNGTAEEVRISPSGTDSERRKFAFALSYPDRMRRIGEALVAMDAEATCQSRTKLVVATLDAAGTVTEARQIDVDDGALASEARGVEFISSLEQPAIVVEYDGSYGNREWAGEVQWREVILADSMVIATRMPVSWARKDPTGTERSGSIANAEGEKPSLEWYLPLGATATAISLESGDDFRVRKFTFPPGENGLMSGWVLLGRI